MKKINQKKQHREGVDNMKVIPENRKDIEKLLYEQLAVLIEKSKNCSNEIFIQLNKEIRETALLLRHYL